MGKLVDGLKDESEPYRKMVMETIEKVTTNSFFGFFGGRGFFFSDVRQ